MEEIDLKEIFNIFWNKKLSIFIIVFLFIILGCVYTLKFTSPIYSSSITLILVSSKNEENKNSTITSTDVTVNAKLIATYSKLIESSNVLNEVISNLNMQIDEDTLRDSVTVTSESTGLIKITVKNESSEYSAQITNEIAKVFEAKVKELYNINNIQVMDEASIPTEPSNINHKKDVIMFAAIGILIAVIYVIILNILDNTIKSAETIENEFNLPVLASIPNYEKGGKKV